MKLRNNRATLILLLGDILLFIVALWVTLLIRYSQLPTSELFGNHLGAFSIIWAAWIVVFFIFDLYRRPTSIFKRELPRVIATAQVINTVLAIIFFYYVPVVGIAPRTNLFIYLIVSFAFIVVWRRYLFHYFYRGRQEKVVLLGGGAELQELKEELLANPDYNVVVKQETSLESLTNVRNAIVVFNPDDPSLVLILPKVYQLIFSGATLVTLQDMYEMIFHRVPISAVSERWIFDNISTPHASVYDFVKRIIDVLVSVPIALISLVVYPFITAVIKLTDGGPIFYTDERVGRGGKKFFIYKFRSMSFEAELSLRQVTVFGKFLRKTRLDELPQLWSVIKGDQSLVGPRPEKPSYASTYRQEIPYYDVRHLIAPGLSGWAQIYQDNHPHFGPKVIATKEKLAYDLYYVKHRSLWLDLAIGLKTARILLETKGI